MVLVYGFLKGRAKDGTMNDLYLRGLNLSKTFGFLMKMNSDTLLRIYKGLLDDRAKYHPDDHMQTAITWHCKTIEAILDVRE